MRHWRVPEGRKNDPEKHLLSPLTGLGIFPAPLYPPLKRWAIFECPCGTKTSAVHGQSDGAKHVKIAADSARSTGPPPEPGPSSLEAGPLSWLPRADRSDRKGRIAGNCTGGPDRAAGRGRCSQAVGNRWSPAGFRRPGLRFWGHFPVVLSSRRGC